MGEDTKYSYGEESGNTTTEFTGIKDNKGM